MTLIERLEAATVGSRELDAEIFGHLHAGDNFYVGIRHGQTWAVADTSAGGRIDILRYTQSLDAAMTLVPEGYDWRAGSFDGNKSFNAVVTTPELAAWNWDAGCNSSANPALALAIACLKARDLS